MNGSKFRIKIIAGLVFFVIIVCACVWFIQRTVENQVRAGLTDLAAQQNVTLALGEVSYDFPRNILEIHDIKLQMPSGGQALNYAVEKISVINPNRRLALAAAQGKAGEVQGVVPVADTVEIVNYAAGPEPEMRVALQRILGIGLNMDAMKPLLTGEANTPVRAGAVFAKALSYDQRQVQGIRVTVKDSAGTNVAVSVASSEDNGYARLTLQGFRANDFVIQAKTPQETVDITLKEWAASNISVSEKALELTAESQENPALAEKAAKALFLGERPLVNTMTLKDIRYTDSTESMTIAALRYENSATRPFTFSVAVDNLVTPAAAVFGNAAALLSNTPNTDISLGVSAILPTLASAPADPKALTNVTVNATIKDLGTLSQTVVGVLPSDMGPEKAMENFKVSSLKVTYTDAGLTPRALEVAKATTGLDILALGPLGSEVLWASIPEAKRTPYTRQLLEKVLSFLKQPGSLTLTITPTTPMTFEELNQLTPQEGVHTLEVVAPAAAPAATPPAAK